MGSQLSAFMLVGAALALGSIGSNAVAQSSAEPPESPAQAEPPGSGTDSARISDDDLATFAQIYTDLEESKSQHEAALAEARNAEEADRIHEDLQRESGVTVSKHGWTIDKFNSFVRIINADPALAERTTALIQAEQVNTG